MDASLPSILAIHSTTPCLGLGLSQPGQDDQIKTWDVGRAMSTELHDCLKGFMNGVSLTSLDGIAVAAGPGGFTSTRIGVVLARTLAQQLDVPLFGLSTLATVAWHQVIQGDEDLLAARHGAGGQQAMASSDGAGPDIVRRLPVEMAARREQVFGAVYDVVVAQHANMSSEVHALQLQVCHGDRVMDRDQWQHVVDQASQTAPSVVPVNAEGPLGHTVAALLALAILQYRAGERPHWSTVQPFYGQSPV